MGEHTRDRARSHGDRPDSLGELIHAAVRRAIEVAVNERTLTGPTGPLALIVSASWSAGRSACAASMAGTRIAVEGRIDTTGSAEIASFWPSSPELC